jgi:hypothetical protein
MTNAPKVVVALTLCEASTLCGNPLFVFGLVDFPPEQETRVRPAHNPVTTIRTRFVKRLAPKNMKKVDLTVKWSIIADPNAALLPSPGTKHDGSCILKNHGG